MTFFSCRTVKNGFFLAWGAFALGFAFLFGAALVPQSFMPALIWYTGLGLIVLSAAALALGVVITLVLPSKRFRACF